MNNLPLESIFETVLFINDKITVTYRVFPAELGDLSESPVVETLRLSQLRVCKNDKKNHIKIDLLFRSIIDLFYIDYRHNRDDCVLVDERHVLGVMSRPQRPQGGAHVSAQPDRWRQLQNQHQHR